MRPLALLIFACCVTLSAAPVSMSKDGKSESAASGTGASPGFNPVIQPFLQEHCYSCHGEKKVKGDLRLDQVDTDLTKPSSFERWREIMNRMEAGEMPPKKEPRPPSAKLAAVVGQLSAQLDATAVKQRAEGRVVLRRLNRVEYENTVRDLFATPVAVKGMLPPDASKNGFDNVGSALQMSPVQMERYLEAADAVVTAALTPVHQLKSTSQQLSYEVPAWITSWKQDDGLILFRNLDDGGGHDLRAYRAPAPGIYRFRLTVSAHNSTTPLTAVVQLGQFVVTALSVNRLLGYYEVPPGKPSVIELEERLMSKNDTIEVVPTGLPHVYLKKDNMAKYPGPGLKIHGIEIEGPLPEAWPTESYRRVLGQADAKNGTLAEAEKVLQELLPRAFRHPTTAADLKPFVALVAAALNKGKSFEAAMRTGIKGVLVSPDFLYLREPAGRLDDYALAARLSYFLWSTMPDEALLTAAAKGELREPRRLHAQVERMLNHPKAKAFTENFTGQWLGLRDIDATTPDKAIYPEFDDYLKWSSVRETHLFFEELLKGDLSVRNIVDSDFALVNGRLALHYGIPDVVGTAFRKVKLKPEQHRGGLLTQASVLKLTANGSNTSPVLRGVWLQDRILGRPLPPPPPNVPAIEPDIRGATTIREILAKHRETENCAGCHSRIDPAGYALENYDVIGGWRDRYRILSVDQKNAVNNRKGHPLGTYLAAFKYGLGLPVVAADTLPDGRKFDDLTGLKKLLLTNPEQLARNLTERLVTYATGQPVSFGDHAAIKQILTQAKPADYGLRTLVHGVVQSELFLNK